MPFKQMPVLEIDGKVLNQSTSITRYLSKKAGLAGSDEWESLLIDIAVDNIHDLRQGTYNGFLFLFMYLLINIYILLFVKLWGHMHTIRMKNPKPRNMDL